jgi:hypothetical protein
VALPFLHGTSNFRLHDESLQGPFGPLTRPSLTDLENTEQFALTEASYVIVRLMQRFDKLENVEVEVTPKHKLTLTNCSGSGVRVRMREAKA